MHTYVHRNLQIYQRFHRPPFLIKLRNPVKRESYTSRVTCSCCYKIFSGEKKRSPPFVGIMLNTVTIFLTNLKWYPLHIPQVIEQEAHVPQFFNVINKSSQVASIFTNRWPWNYFVGKMTKDGEVIWRLSQLDSFQQHSRYQILVSQILPHNQWTDQCYFT